MDGSIFRHCIVMGREAVRVSNVAPGFPGAHELHVKLIPLLKQALPLEERLAVLYALTATGQADLAFAQYELWKDDFLSRLDLASDVGAFLFRQGLLRHILVELPEGLRPWWVDCREYVHPVHIVRVTLPFSYSADSRVQLEDACICGFRFRFSLLGTQPDFCMESPYEWICPYCLARRAWDEDRGRNDVLSLVESLGMHAARGDVPQSEREKRLVAWMKLVHALRDFALIRFGTIRTERVGHCAIEPSFYSIEKQTDPILKNTLDYIDFSTNKAANTWLVDAWRRTLPAKFPLASEIWKLEGKYRVFQDKTRHRVLGATYVQDARGLLTRDGWTPPLTFTPEEHAFALEELDRMGIPRGAKIACLLVRDDVYLDKALPGVDWSYHNYRNADIDTYRPAMEWLASQGWYVLRVGAFVRKPLAWNSCRIIDYATSFRSELMDIWLVTHCNFFISTLAGFDLLAPIFKIPLLLTNVLPSYYPLGYKGVFVLPKYLWSRKESRLLNPEEHILDACYSQTQEYKQHELEILDNSPEQLLEAVQETMARVKGTWRPSTQERALEEKWTRRIDGRLPRLSLTPSPDPSISTRPHYGQYHIMDGRLRAQILACWLNIYQDDARPKERDG